MLCFHSSTQRCVAGRFTGLLDTQVLQLLVPQQRQVCPGNDYLIFRRDGVLFDGRCVGRRMATCPDHRGVQKDLDGDFAAFLWSGALIRVEPYSKP